MTLHDFARLCMTLHDLTLHDFACVNDTFKNVFLQPWKVVLQSIANTCKVDFLWQRSIVLHRNNRITKNCIILMVCYYLNDLQYSPTWCKKVNVWFRGFGKCQEREGGYGAAFLENLDACASFLDTKATRNYNPLYTTCIIKSKPGLPAPDATFALYS